MTSECFDLANTFGFMGTQLRAMNEAATTLIQAGLVETSAKALVYHRFVHGARTAAELTNELHHPCEMAVLTLCRPLQNSLRKGFRAPEYMVPPETRATLGGWLIVTTATPIKTPAGWLIPALDASAMWRIERPGIHGATYFFERKPPARGAAWALWVGQTTGRSIPPTIEQVRGTIKALFPAFQIVE